MINWHQYLEFKEISRFSNFAKKRGEGAEKISEKAKEKGGYALLTHYHFKVKLPYYQKAESNFNIKEAKREYQQLLGQLQHLNVQQKEFQETVGKLEVLGELIIAHQ